MNKRNWPLLFLVVLSLVFSSCALFYPEPPLPVRDQTFAQGEKHFLAADFPAAVSAFSSFLAQKRRSPYVARAHYFRGKAYLAMEDYRAAEEDFRQAQKKARSDEVRAGALIGLGDVAFVQDNFASAKAYYKRALKFPPDAYEDDAVRHKLALSYARLNLWYEAKNLLVEIYMKYPQSPRAHIAKEVVARGRGFYVQVGAFNERSSAENLRAQLAAQGYPAAIEEIFRHEQIFYAVRIGRLISWAEARKLEAELRSRGYDTFPGP
jgi:TolA-binding protein